MGFLVKYLVRYLGMKWLKNKILTWAIDALIEYLIGALHKMAKSSTSQVDDQLVETLDRESEQLKFEIKEYLS